MKGVGQARVVLVSTVEECGESHACILLNVCKEVVDHALEMHIWAIEKSIDGSCAYLASERVMLFSGRCKEEGQLLLLLCAADMFVVGVLV